MNKIWNGKQKDEECTTVVVLASDVHLKVFDYGMKNGEKSYTHRWHSQIFKNEEKKLESSKKEELIRESKWSSCTNKWQITRNSLRITSNANEMFKETLSQISILIGEHDDFGISVYRIRKRVK